MEKVLHAGNNPFSFKGKKMLLRNNKYGEGKSRNHPTEVGKSKNHPTEVNKMNFPHSIITTIITITTKPLVLLKKTKPLVPNKLG
jgi:hypothetical protein